MDGTMKVNVLNSLAVKKQQLEIIHVIIVETTIRLAKVGELIRKGSMAIGRMPPACDECPGWHNDIDVNGQTICNGKGTCNPEIDAFDEYVGMMCSCTTDIGTGLPYQGEWCQCLAERENSNFCQACTQGFYLTADIESSKQQGKAIDKEDYVYHVPVRRMVRVWVPVTL